MGPVYPTIKKWIPCKNVQYIKIFKKNWLLIRKIKLLISKKKWAKKMDFKFIYDFFNNFSKTLLNSFIFIWISNCIYVFTLESDNLLIY